MRRIFFIAVAAGAAIVVGLTVVSRVHAQTTGHEAITICADGQGHISVSGTGFSPDLNSEQPNVWVGNVAFTDSTHIIGDDSAALVVDSSGAFTSSLPASDLPASSLGTPAGTVAVATGDYVNIYGPIVISSIDSCSTTGGGPIATQVAVTGTPPSSPAAQPTIALHGVLADAQGNPVHTAGITITFTASDGSTTSCVTDSTGQCSPPPLPLTSPGETFGANIPGGTGTFGGSLQLTGTLAPAPSAAQTTISASPGSIAADGTSTSTITVQTKDQFGFNETTSAGTVTLSTSRGTLSNVVDNHNGTYSATLTSSTGAGTASVTGTLNGSPIGRPATLLFTQVASTSQSTISASPTAAPADGTGTTTITVQVKDLAGANFNSNAGPVTLSTTRGTFANGCTTNCPTQFNGNGSYSATLNAGTGAGSAVVTGAINNLSMSNSTTVTLTPVANAGNSTISGPTQTVVADGTSSGTITVQIKDFGGANFGNGGGTVALMTTLGTLSAVTDNGNGTYTATITSTTPGVAIITGTFNGTAIGGSASVTFTQLVITNVGCPSGLGDVNGGLDAKGGLKINVEADCDPADKKHPTPRLHHAHIHVEGLGLKIESTTNDGDHKKGDVSGVTLTQNADGSKTARFNGTFNGKSFVLTVTDGGQKPKMQDSFDFVYDGVHYGPYLTPHGNVHVDLDH